MTTSRYSGTPLKDKLGIKPGSTLGLVNAPSGFRDLLGPLDGVDVTERPRRSTDVVVVFVTRRVQLERRFDPLARAVAPSGALWIAWPKRSSKVPTDVTEDVCRDVALPKGLVDNKVCAIDETWSGLRLVWRKENR